MEKAWQAKLHKIQRDETVVPGSPGQQSDCGATQKIQSYSGDLFRAILEKVAWSPVRNSYIPLELPLGKDLNKHIQILVAVLKNY